MKKEVEHRIEAFENELFKNAPVFYKEKRFKIFYLVVIFLILLALSYLSYLNLLFSQFVIYSLVFVIASFTLRIGGKFCLMLAIFLYCYALTLSIYGKADNAEKLGNFIFVILLVSVIKLIIELKKEYTT